MTRKELEKRAVILNVLELAFNEKQSIYGLEIEQASKSDNLFKCCLYDASTLEVINDFTSNYGTIKRYILSLPIISISERTNIA